MNCKILNHFYEKLAVAFLVGGAILRVLVWSQNRNFFIDEANLVTNFLEKSYFEVFKPLDYQQYAPPFFSILEKMMLQLFGASERVARAIPLLAGLISLVVFWKIARRFLSPIAVAAACLFFAFDGCFVEYATTAKQYSTDVLVTLLLVFFAQSIEYQRFKWFWAMFGALIIWFSMSSIFGLAGVGMFWFATRKSIFSSKNLELLPVFGAWVLSFMVNYFCCLQKNIADPNLRVSHVFLPVFPKNAADFQVWISFFQGLSNWLIGFTFIALLVFFGGFLASLRQFFLQKKAKIWLLLTPFLTVLLASMAGQYSLKERMILFLMPSFLLFLAIGWDAFLKKKESNSLIINQLSRWIAVGLILIAAGGQLKINWFFEKFQIEESRDGLDFFLKNRGAADVLFVHQNYAPTVRFSVDYFPEKYPIRDFVICEKWRDEPDFFQKDIETWRKTHEKGEIFVLFHQPDTENARAFFFEKNKTAKVFEFVRGAVWRIDFQK